MLATPSLKRTIHVSGDEISESWDCGEGPMAPLLRIALSAADVLRQDSWRKIIECDREVCGWLAIDISRNHSRRYCTSSGCGNTARVQRHYRRHKSERRLLGIERRTRTKAQRRRLGQGQTRSF
jgi:predicted RNA-binding Zn ribbon-like protein